MKRTRNIIAATIGNALEVYDNTLYTYFAIILGPLFFPHENPLTVMLATFGTLAAGYIARPLGSLYFSHIGDRLGRKKALLISMFTIIVPTFIIGLLPTYSVIGVSAPIILISCRLIQGFCIGGELGGVMTFVVEHAAPNRKGFYASFIAMSSHLGGLIATSLGVLCLQPFMPSWGWRLPFLFGGLVGTAGYFIRRYITESKEFIELQESKNIARYPLIDVIKNQKINTLRAFGVAAGVLVPFFMVISYLNGILKNDFSFSALEIMQCSVFLKLIAVILSPFMGLIADRIGIQILMKIASGLLLITSYSLFSLLNEPSLSYETIIFIQICISILCVAFAAPCSAYLSSLFPVKERYSGISLGYTLGSAVLGGTSPVISTALLSWTGNYMTPVYYLIICMAIAFLAVYSYQEPKISSLSLVKNQ